MRLVEVPTGNFRSIIIKAKDWIRDKISVHMMSVISKRDKRH